MTINNLSVFHAEVRTEDLEKLKTLSQKKSENVIPVTENNQKMLRRAKQFESLYKQLKKQFDDKKDVLHKTRQELFLTNEKLQAYLRKNQMAEFDISPIEKKYIFGLFELENEIKRLEKENNSLEDVISNILS